MNNELLKDFKTKFEAMSDKEQYQVIEFGNTLRGMHHYLNKLNLEECKLLAEIVTTRIKHREAELASLNDSELVAVSELN